MRIIGRIAALIVGLIGAFDALVVNIVVSSYHDASRLLGSGADPSHGFIGLGLVILAFAGALLALRSPIAGGVLLLIAGIAFFFVVHWWGLLASPQLLAAGALAIADRDTTPRQALERRGGPRSLAT
ncbi:MAG: hypothetical protein PVSMB4_04550 [Ktedonobacterales bacterium]